MEIEFTDVEVANLFKIPLFKIRSGEKLLIQGPSGRGKTTLLHLIGGLLQPDLGQITVGGKNLRSLSDTELSQWRRQDIGFVFQKLNLIEHLTTLENLKLSSIKEDEELLSLLKKVRLEDKASQWAGKLSLGEQQRLAVTRVLAQDPRLILADEPTSSLDEANAQNVIDLLLLASKGPKTLVVVSHDKRLHSFFDRVVDLEDIFA